MFDEQDRTVTQSAPDGSTPTHPHAVTSANASVYAYDANGNQTTRTFGSDHFDLVYDAENRLVEVQKNDTTIAEFTFDGNGQRVMSVMDGETIRFVGGTYEKKGNETTKYYMAGATRVAMRKYAIPQNMTVEYMLGDYLGSTSITTDSSGALVSEMRYKPWGETRYTWTDPDLSTTPVYEMTKYTFTGQYSYDVEFGLKFYNARWLDSTTGRFAQADSIVPREVQGYDRYAYASNNPIRYIDPSGHLACDGSGVGEECEQANPDDLLNWYGITTSGLTTKQKWALADGTILIDMKLAVGGYGSFQNRFGKVTVNGGANMQGCKTEGGVITCGKLDCGNEKCAPTKFLTTMLHEMGHVFENHNRHGDIYASDLDAYSYQGISIDDCGGYWCRTTIGFKCDGWGCLEHPPFLDVSQTDGDAKAEQWADLFMNWVLDSTGDPNHGFTAGTDGDGRRTNMAQQFYWVLTGTGATCPIPVGLTCSQ